MCGLQGGRFGGPGEREFGRGPPGDFPYRRQGGPEEEEFDRRRAFEEESRFGGRRDPYEERERGFGREEREFPGERYVLARDLKQIVCAKAAVCT